MRSKSTSHNDYYDLRKQRRKARQRMEHRIETVYMWAYEMMVYALPVAIVTFIITYL